MGKQRKLKFIDRFDDSPPNPPASTVQRNARVYYSDPDPNTTRFANSRTHTRTKKMMVGTVMTE